MCIRDRYGIGSGGLFGQGIGNGTQKLSWLPYGESDFIFSIIAEELGLVGAVVDVYKRQGIHPIILPKDNEADLEELPESVRSQLNFIFATEIGDVLKNALVTEKK